MTDLIQVKALMLMLRVWAELRVVLLVKKLHVTATNFLSRRQ